MRSQDLRKLLDRKGVHPDQVRSRGNVFEVRRTYFYRHGNTVEGWASAVAKALPSDLMVTGYRDDFASWPRDSYFTALVTHRP